MSESEDYFNNYETDYRSGVPTSYSTDELLRYILDSDQVVEEIGHKLRGEVYDPHTEKFVQKYDAMMNDKGVNSVMNILNSHMTKNFKTAVLDTDSINQMCKEMRYNIIMIFFEKYKEFGIDKSNLNIIVSIIDNSIYNHVSTSKNGEFLRLIKSVTTVVNQKVERYDQGQNGQGFLDKIFKRK